MPAACGRGESLSLAAYSHDAERRVVRVHVREVDVACPRPCCCAPIVSACLRPGLMSTPFGLHVFFSCCELIVQWPRALARVVKMNTVAGATPSDVDEPCPSLVRAWYTGCRGARERYTGGRARCGRLRQGVVHGLPWRAGGRGRGGWPRRVRGTRVAVARGSVARVAVNAVAGCGGGGVHGLPWSAARCWLCACYMVWCERACMMGARVVVVEVAGRGGLRWQRGTRVAVVRCSLLAETAVGRSKIVEKPGA